MAPLPAGEVGSKPRLDLFRLAARPLEEKTVEVEGNEGEHLRATRLHEPALLPSSASVRFDDEAGPKEIHSREIRLEEVGPGEVCPGEMYPRTVYVR
jgi:hypothetical protein